ncbi:MAG: OmpA family protein [Hyphomicrobiaceae bacterium]
MRCRPLRWLLGLVPLALLAAALFHFERPRIEADLTARTEAALQAAGVPWAEASFEGRDGVVSGAALDDGERARAGEIARGTWGVRVVEDRSGLIDEIKPYSWSATREGNRIRLKGYVPSEDDRRTIIGLVRGSLPGVEVDDRMQLGRGVPARDVWLKGVGFGVDQLDRLKDGQVRLDDLGFSIRGEARTGKAFADVEAALSDGLPRGVTLSADNVVPPLASPYRWSANFDGRRILVEGSVPSLRIRDDLLATLRERMPASVVVDDRMEVASGTPEGDDGKWRTAVLSTLGELSRLESGTASLRDNQLDFSGLAGDQDTADAVTAAVRQGLPALYRSREDVKYLRARLPVAKPFVFSATWRDGRTVALEGSVPGEEARSALIDAVRAAFPGATLDDRTTLARGEPDSWRRAVVAGLDQLARLDSGRLAMRDTAVEISGRIATRDAADDVVRALTGDLPAGYALKSGIEANEPVVTVARPYVWAAELADGRLTLTGSVPDRAGRDELVATARRLFPGARLDDRTEIASGEPADWASAAGEALNALSLLKSGRAGIEDRDVRVSGLAASDAEAARVADAMRLGLPVGFRGTSDVEVEGPAVPVAKPYSWSIERRGRDVTIAGFVPDEGSRKAVLDLLARSIPGARVEDRMSVAGGMAGEVWQRGTSYVVRQIGQLAEGGGRISDKDIWVSGIAEDGASYSAVLADLARAPGGFTVRGKDVALPAVDPFDWRAEVEGERVILAGHVPSEEARRALLDYARQRFTGLTVDDRMELAAGIAGSERDWRLAAILGIRSLAISGNGRAELIGSDLKVTGETHVEALPGNVRTLIARGLPRGYTGTSDIAYLGPSPEDLAAREAAERKAEEDAARAAEDARRKTEGYSWSARYDGLNIAFEGSVPDEDTKRRIRSSAETFFPDRRIDDRTRVDSGAPEGFVDAVRALLRRLSELESGEATITGRSGRLTGSTDSEAVKQRLRRNLSGELPDGFKGEDEITFVEPPKPDPEDVARRKAEEAVDTGALLASGRELKADECQAVLNSIVRKGEAFFASGSAELTAGSLRTLGRLPGITKRCPQATIAIEGHTDSDGAAAFNQHLSELRAEAVVDFLASKGVPRERLTAVGFGEMRPVVPNTTRSNKAKNRRIEFEVRIE